MKRFHLHAGAGDGSTRYSLSHLPELIATLKAGQVLEFFDIEMMPETEMNFCLKGTAHWDEENRRWYALLNQSRFRHESDLRS